MFHWSLCRFCFGLGFYIRGVEYKAARWLHEQTLSKLSLPPPSDSQSQSSAQPASLNTQSVDSRVATTTNGDDAQRSSVPAGGWEERKEAQGALEHYLNDLPNTIAFLHGPAGSGKGTLMQSVVGESSR